MTLAKISSILQPVYLDRNLHLKISRIFTFSHEGIGYEDGVICAASKSSYKLRQRTDQKAKRFYQLQQEIEELEDIIGSTK